MNGDGLSDVVVSGSGNSPSGEIGVLYQNARGTLNGVTGFDSYNIAGRIEIADRDGDGRKDIIVGYFEGIDHDRLDSTPEIRRRPEEDSRTGQRRRLA